MTWTVSEISVRNILLFLVRFQLGIY